MLTEVQKMFIEVHQRVSGLGLKYAQAHRIDKNQIFVRKDFEDKNKIRDIIYDECLLCTIGTIRSTKMNASNSYLDTHSETLFEQIYKEI